MNRSESKYFNTAKKMDQAFIDLLSKKDIEYITVKDICAKAGVNRSTFYLHYETIQDLLDECLEHLNKEFLSYFAPRDRAEEVFMSEKFLKPYLTYIKENKRIYLMTLKNSKVLNLDSNKENMFIHIVEPVMAKRNIPQDQRRYMFSFYLDGIMSIIRLWLKEDCTKSIDEIMNIIIRCVM